MVLAVAEGAAIVVALLTIYKRRTLRSLRNVLFASLALVAAEIWFSLYFRQLYTAEATLIRGAPGFDQVWHWVQLIAGSLAVLLGIGGLVLVLLKWETYRRGDLSTA
jgi:hypothetical protein